MNVENAIFNKFENNGLRCRHCQKPIECGSYCEGCFLSITQGSLKPEEITGTTKGNRHKEKKPVEGKEVPDQYRRRSAANKEISKRFN